MKTFGTLFTESVKEVEDLNEQIQLLDEMPGANMDTRAVHKHLKKQGWSLTRSSGGHDVFTHPDAKHHIPVPRHRQLKAPLVKGILKQSEVRKEEVEQIDEISTGLATSYLNKREPQHKPNMNSPETSNRDAKVSQGLSAAGRRISGSGPQKNKQNTVTGRFEYRKNVGATHTFNKEEVEQLEEGRPSQRHPLEGHDYHRKTDAELEYIAKDAHKAAEAMKSHNTDAENKYRDQASDSATVRYFRKKNGMPNWYKKKYGHVNEDNVIGTNTPNSVLNNPATQTNITKKKQVIDRYTTGTSRMPSATNVVASPRESVEIQEAYDVKGFAKRMARKNAGLTENENTLSSYDKEDTPAKKTLSKTAGMVKDLASKAKEKAKTKKSDDTFQPEPELASNIVR